MSISVSLLATLVLTSNTFTFTLTTSHFLHPHSATQAHDWYLFAFYFTIPLLLYLDTPLCVMLHLIVHHDLLDVALLFSWLLWHWRLSLFFSFTIFALEARSLVTLYKRCSWWFNLSEYSSSLSTQSTYSVWEMMHVGHEGMLWNLSDLLTYWIGFCCSKERNPLQLHPRPIQISTCLVSSRPRPWLYRIFRYEPYRIIPSSQVGLENAVV